VAPQVRGFMGINFGKWIGNAVKTAGKPFQLAGDSLQSIDGAVTHEIRKIPVVGSPLAATFDSPFRIAASPALIAGQIAHGGRIDKVVLGQLRSQLADFKAAGPWAQSIVSFVPGVGTGISAAIGAGLALANGQPISQAMIAAARGAIPGGALATAAFDVAQQGVAVAAHHGKVTWDVIAKAAGSAGADLAELPDAAKQALIATLTTVGGLTQGEKPDMAIADGAAIAASSALPPPAAKALQISLAIAHAKELQSAQKKAVEHPSTQNRLMAIGQQIQVSDPTVKAARDQLQNGKRGFDIGIGMMAQASSTNDIVTIRNSLSPIDKQGFDVALSLHIGRVANPEPQGMGPKGLAGYYTTMGMQGAELASKQSAMAALTAHPVVTVGAKTAVDSIESARAKHHENVLIRFWHWLKNFVIN
jgi:hypothetical protein